MRRFREQAAGRDRRFDLWIVSAGYSLVAGDRPLAPYECTFTGMPKADARAWADVLGIPDAFRCVVGQPYDLGLVLLGDAYIAALRLDPAVMLGGPTIFVVSAKAAGKVLGIANAHTLPFSVEDTRRFACGLVGLKGEIGGRLLTCLADGGAIQRLLDRKTDLAALTADVSDRPAQPSDPAPRIRPNPAADWVIQLPPSWRAKPHRPQLRSFIPDWDDRVDPHFDFVHDARERRSRRSVGSARHDLRQLALPSAPAPRPLRASIHAHAAARTRVNRNGARPAASSPAV